MRILEDLLDLFGECGVVDPVVFICFDKKMWLLRYSSALSSFAASIIYLKHSDSTWLTIKTSGTAFANEGAKRIT